MASGDTAGRTGKRAPRAAAGRTGKRAPRAAAGKAGKRAPRAAAGRAGKRAPRAAASAASAAAAGRRARKQTSAGTVLFRVEDSRTLFLFLRHRAGHWDFAKGKMEKGESARETAIREAKEETGITGMEFLEGFEERIRYDFQVKGRLIHKKVIFFLAETTTRTVAVSDEHYGYVWLDYDTSIGEIVLKKNARNVLAKAHAALSARAAKRQRRPRRR